MPCGVEKACVAFESTGDDLTGRFAASRKRSDLTGDPVLGVLAGARI